MALLLSLNNYKTIKYIVNEKAFHKSLDSQGITWHSVIGRCDLRDLERPIDEVTNELWGLFAALRGWSQFSIEIYWQ